MITKSKHVQKKRREKRKERKKTGQKEMGKKGKKKDIAHQHLEAIAAVPGLAPGVNRIPKPELQLHG